MQKRILLFLLGCIGLRILFVFVAKGIDPQHLPILGFLALIPATGFAYLFITKKRTSGLEVFGQKIWWMNLRPVHSLLYFSFALAAITRRSYAWMFLAADVLLGLSAFLIHHYRQGDFAKL